MKNTNIYVLSLLLILTASCASSLEGELDEAMFALDNCSTTNTTPCTDAITAADTLLASDPTNVEVSLVKSSALATRGGIDLLDLMAELARTGVSGGFDNDTQKFRVIHDVVVGNVSSTTDIRSSITVLTGIAAPATTDAIYKTYYFQLGILQSIEAFVLPTITAQPTSTSTVTSTSVTATNRDNVEDDFVNADDNMITGGITSGKDGFELVEIARINYCVLKNISGAAGFTLAELQDLMSCQLCIDVTDVSICPKSSTAMTGAAGDFQSTIATCADFNFDACSGSTATAL